ncbi:hypothetical protein DPMN_124040 [Dreissena polymorpha]|uniref:Uncharacterized protein n=2 Tax=Dreissena polymorpha TaxID=45954 RepID=A0A9D4GVM5_DREPO|nr:hypothetical protein DPMN_124040 [Dreissena polymorpha]
MHPDSKFLGMGGQRSGLPLSEDQGHSMLTGSQSRMMHSNSLPMMHASMKSPLTPPGGPLELTVNSHSRNMGTDSRKYSLDSNKFPMVGDLPHDSKNFQRSLSERIPDRGPEKLENILDQRYGFQNHFREVNRFGDRSFEPFSPSRLNEAVRSFDFKEIEAKLLDPSLSGEKFQRMAENFNEFRSRFQDQMFRRDGMRQGGYQMDGRNMLPEMTDRNSFFNSRSDNNDLANRERFEISRSFNSMSVNDVDNFGNNRDDNMRNRNRDEMGSRNDLNSPNYHRGRESAAENMSMNIKNQMDMRRNNLGLEQNSSIRNNALSADNIISRPGELSHPDNPHVVSEPRPAIMSASEREMAMSSRHSHQMKPTSQSDLMALRQGQRMESLSETEIMSLRQQQCRSMESNEAEMLSIRHRQSNGLNSASEIEMMQMRHMSQNGLELHNDTDMMSLRPIPGSQMENNNEQGMMPLHRRRADLGTNVMNTRMFASHMDMDGMRSSCHDISPRPGMMSNGPNRVDGVTHMEMVERSREQNNLSYEGRMHSSTDIIKSSQSEYGMMSRNSMMMSHEREKRQHRPEDVGMETGVKMATMEAERNVSTPKSRLVSTGNICSNMEVSSTNQGYLEKSSEQHLLNQDSVIQDSMNLTQSGGLQNSMINHHGSSKENSTSAMMDDGDIDFDGRGNEKNSSSPNNLSDPNMIRQRKQRKPANPQHVFMPSLDHYTSFAVDEGEECSPLI